MKTIDRLNSIFSSKVEINIEKDNEHYEGTEFIYENKTYKSRLAKKTPTKNGYFVVFYKKNNEGINEPFSSDENIDELIIFVLDDKIGGYFKFNKEILLKQGILKNKENCGKMGFRVYAPWNNNLNKTAQKNKLWQTKYFVNFE